MKDAFKFWEILKAYYNVRTGIQGKKNKIDKNENPTFAGFNELERVLMNCKNLTHEEFRNSDEKNPEDPHNLFDLRIGASYHEFLHVKEYVYTLQVYFPKIQETKDPALRAAIADAFQNLQRKSKELYDIFKECDEIILKILPEYKDSNLPRIMYVHREIIDKFFGTNLDRMYEAMFGSSKGGYLRAAKIFQEKGFYDWAERAGKDACSKI